MPTDSRPSGVAEGPPKPSFASGTEWERALPAARLPGGAAGRVALHYHLSDVKKWRNFLVYLKYTPLCDPRNFVACVYVGDWPDDRAKELSTINDQGTKFGPTAPVRIAQCTDGSVKRKTRPLWYACFKQTLRLAPVLGFSSVLFLADETVLIRSWTAVNPVLQRRNAMVLPELTADFWGEHSRNLRDTVVDRKHSVEPEHRSRILGAVDALGEEDRRAMGISDTSVPFAPALGTVVFLPMSQAAAFERLADHFQARGVFGEHALPLIARALAGGDGAMLGEREQVSLQSLWEGERGVVQAMGQIRNLRSNNRTNQLAFVHPVMVLLAQAKTMDQRPLMFELYREVWCPT